MYQELQYGVADFSSTKFFRVADKIAFVYFDFMISY